VNHAKRLAQEIGYPVIMKATAGGGGKGMAGWLWEEGEVDKAFHTAKLEAATSFKNDGIYMEKFVEEHAI